MHAGWNLISKSKHPTAAFFLVASLSGALLLSPALVLWHDTLAHGIPTRIWMLLVMTGFFMALYYISLAGAYRTGDMSMVYPLARSSPAIVVLIVTLILGQGNQVTTRCIVGIVLVVGGCFLIPIQRFSNLRLRNYLNATCGLSLLAAICTSGYSMLDDQALRELRTDAHATIGNIPMTLLYACLQSWAASLWLAIFVAVDRNSHSHLRQVCCLNKRHAILAGIAIYLTYTMVLISLTFVDNVSYVVGFRQLSIPLGAGFGILILKEPPHKPKLAGVLSVFVGLVLVALG